MSYGFTRVLEASWRGIYTEYLGVRDHLIDWYERELYGSGWKVFGIYDFPCGEALADGVARCPLTAGLVRQHLPTHGAAGYSVMLPGTRIQPHVGYRGEFLRCHLGLEVPPGDCGLTVGGETRAWHEGEALVFDDRVEHSAWNLTSQARVILLVDFVPPA